MKSGTAISLKDVELSLSVGYLEWEKLTRSRILAKVEMRSAQNQWGKKPALSNLIDYQSVYVYLKELEQAPHTESLEEIAEKIIQFCFTIPLVEACTVTLSKPDLYKPETAYPTVTIVKVKTEG